MPHPITSYDEGIPVTAILVNWNGCDHTEACVRSLLAQSLRRVEIVIVDNGSIDGSVDRLRECFGDAVRLLPQSTNIGYGAAINAGIAVARGRFLFALNNDTKLDSGCLAELAAAADRHPNAGTFAPKILSMSAPSVIDNVGHRLYPDGLSRGRGRLEPDQGQYHREEEILLPSGCAVLLRRALLADVGLFDPDLFAYCEDTDLGLRAQLAGWRCVFVPGAVLYHAYSGSSGHYSDLKAFLVERNRVWVAVKCLPGPLLIVSPLMTLLRLFAQGVGALSNQGAAGRFVAERSAAALFAVLLRAWAAAFIGLPHAWSKRREVQARRRASLAEYVTWITRYGMGIREIALKD